MADEIVDLNPLTLYFPQTRIVVHGSKRRRLSHIEAALLNLLIENANTVVPLERIKRSV